MKRAFLFSGGIVAIVVGVFALAYLTSAAGNKFPFTGEGTVQARDEAGGKLKVHFTKMSERAASLWLGAVIEVRIGGAKIYKKDDKGKLKRIKLGNLAIGDRVKVKGNVKTDDRFVASTVTHVDTSFSMKGALKNFNRTTRRMTVDVTTTNYKSSRYKDKTVEFTFGENTRFYTQGVGKSMEDVTASEQKVEVRGKEVGTTLEATYMNENVK